MMEDRRSRYKLLASYAPVHLRLFARIHVECHKCASLSQSNYSET
jgi:hypothetical protein